jgi:aldehyde decarbonylase
MVEVVPLEFIVFASACIFGRTAILWTMMALSRSSFAEKTRVVRRAVPAEQLERESYWLPYFIIVGCELIFFRAFGLLGDMPLFSLTGWIMEMVVHATFIEFIYWWAHYAMHFRMLYRSLHKHHHRSVVCEPTTSVTFLWLEHLIYDAMFAIPPVFAYLMGYGSYFGVAGYMLGFDVCNYIGHCNFEFFPQSWMRSPFKYVVYTPSFHSIHHTNPYHNYSLFLPWTDVLFGTVHQKTTERFEKAFEPPLSGPATLQFEADAE